MISYRAAWLFFLLYLGSVGLACAAFTGRQHHWHHGVASYYGTAGSSGGCGRANGARTFASYQVPCGAKVRFCYRHRCVSGRRTDSGPNGSYRYSRDFDLSTEMAQTLRMTGAGVVSLKWRRLP